MFGVPFECNDVLTLEDMGRCFTAITEGTNIFEKRGAKIIKASFSHGMLNLIPDSGPSLSYVIRRGCAGCPD